MYSTSTHTDVQYAKALIAQLVWQRTAVVSAVILRSAEKYSSCQANGYQNRWLYFML